MPQTNAIRVISDIYSIIKVEKLPPAIRELACLAVVQSKSIEVTYPTTSNELCNYPQRRVTSIKVFCVPSYRPLVAGMLAEKLWGPTLEFGYSCQNTLLFQNKMWSKVA